MQHIAPTNWANPDDLKGLLFFVQRLLELSYPYTQQTYKSPAVSVAGIAQEAVSILDRRWAEDAISKQASHVLDELRARTSANKPLSDILHMPLDRYLSLDLNRTREAAISMKTFLAEINEEAYLSSIVDRVVVLGRNASAKSELDKLATEFASTLLYLGVARDHIHQSLMRVFFGALPVTDSNSIFDFVKAVYPHYHEYTVFVPASTNIAEFDEQSLATLGIKTVDKLPIEIDKIKCSIFASESEKSGFSVFSVSVRAMDYNSAASSAKSKIDRFASLFQLLNHKWSYEVGTTFACKQMCCSSEIEEVHVRGNAMHYIKDNPPERARIELVNMLSARSLLRGPDKSKYLNIIEIHGISARMATADSQLINMWTCLETMSPSDNGSTNIDRVINSVVPMIAIGHVKDVVVTLLLDLFRWNRRKFSKSFQKFGDFKSSKTHKRFVEMMTDQSRPEALSYLLGELEEFELLRYRLFRVTEMLRSKEKLSEAVESAERNIRWNLHRIYRARNGIVHAGKSGGNTKYLVEDVHYYFDKCMQFCIELSTRGRRFNSFELCIKFGSQQYQYYTSVIKKNSYLDHCVWDFKSNKGKGYIFEREETAPAN